MKGFWYELFNLDDQLIRELMNGMWFILSLEVLLALIYYIVWRAIKHPIKPQNIWVEPEVWYKELGTQLALAWACFITGATIRAGWIWLLLECQNRLGHRKDCNYILDTAEWLLLASVFAIVGGVCTIRVMLPYWLRPWSYIVPAVVAVAVPLLVHLLI